MTIRGIKVGTEAGSIVGTGGLNGGAITGAIEGREISQTLRVSTRRHSRMGRVSLSSPTNRTLSEKRYRNVGKEKNCKRGSYDFISASRENYRRSFRSGVNCAAKKSIKSIVNMII